MGGAIPAPPSWLLVLARSLIAASGVAFFCAARIYSNSRPWAPAAFLMGLWFGLYALCARVPRLSIAPELGMMAVYLSVAFVFWQAARRRETHGDWALAAAFAGWAILPLIRMAFGPLSRPGGTDFTVVASFPSLLAAVVMVMVLYEDQRRRVQLNILALSNLNLTTSSFMGGEIQKTLVEALDRVLSVIPMPSGLLTRRFTQGELGLLLTLGNQIGMAVESSYLIQQTTRRSEELHLLNEIGRALSSTLDVDELFNKIFEALKRMFDVSNFYVAMYDAEENQIRFELEITEGIRLPKRSRPFGDHLTEHIIRTRQPLLIRHNLMEDAVNLGLRPVQESGSFCGVPLVAYAKVIGVMALRGLQQNLYDEGHLEMTRVLASEASIAIENARLFREEQTKSRHLALLNNISRHAITTLNPEEMVSRVAQPS